MYACTCTYTFKGKRKENTGEKRKEKHFVYKDMSLMGKVLLKSLIEHFY